MESNGNEPTKRSRSLGWLENRLARFQVSAFEKAEPHTSISSDFDPVSERCSEFALFFCWKRNSLLLSANKRDHRGPIKGLNPNDISRMKRSPNT